MSTQLIDIALLGLYIVPSSPPQDIRVMVISSTSVFVSWRPPVLTGQNGMIVNYSIMAGQDSRNDNTTKVINGTNANINGMVCLLLLSLHKM